MLHNDRVPQQILTNVFNTRENNMMLLKINNETVRIETYKPRISTGMWHIDFALHNSQKKKKIS